MVAAWDDGHLLQARLTLVRGGEVVIRPRRATHPVLGPCHEVTLGDTKSLALFGAVDLARPGYIPAMDRPGALPPGAGTAILNVVAERAPGPLRYRGPYPTGALFDALLECFVVPDPIAAASRFVADAEQCALEARVVEVPVAFTPAPFERHWPQPGICVQLRTGVERVWVDGVGFSALAAGARRVVPDGDDVVAALVLGGTIWGVVARLGADGTVREVPRAVPPPPERLCGRPLPGSIREVMRASLVPRAPDMLRAALDTVFQEAPMIWGDPGLDVAAVRGGELVLHAGLLERLASQPPDAILRFVAEAIEGPARQLAIAQVLPTVAPP